MTFDLYGDSRLQDSISVFEMMKDEAKRNPRSFCHLFGSGLGNPVLEESDQGFGDRLTSASSSRNPAVCRRCSRRTDRRVARVVGWFYNRTGHGEIICQSICTVSADSSRTWSAEAPLPKVVGSA